MRRPLVAGNWKMHGTRGSIAKLVAELSVQAMPADVDVAIFPGLIHLQTVLAAVADCAIVVGSQDCAVQMEEGGANWRNLCVTAAGFRLFHGNCGAF